MYEPCLFESKYQRILGKWRSFHYPTAYGTIEIFLNSNKAIIKYEGCYVPKISGKYERISTFPITIQNGVNFKFKGKIGKQTIKYKNMQYISNNPDDNGEIIFNN